jgi:DNA-directed RNA polymerase specialized sigma24 family protein
MLHRSKGNSPERENELIAIYQSTGCVDSLDEIIRGRAAWVWSVVNKIPLLPWADRDACYADALSEIALSVHRFEQGRDFGRFLGRIITRAAQAQQAKQNTQHSDIDFNLHVDPQEDTAGEVLSEIYAIVESIPPEEINDSTQLVIRRILGGHSTEEIARMMDWTLPRARAAVEHVRCFIAHKMREKGLSASPWIPDCELDDLAQQYEESVRWRFDG